MVDSCFRFLPAVLDMTAINLDTASTEWTRTINVQGTSLYKQSHAGLHSKKMHFQAMDWRHTTLQIHLVLESLCLMRA